ncbi:GNAT family N-acetyltransferase [Brachybacterium tyrofermentans]|uniref:GNAT family N-acetyltransferase n=1 Tax=Brachybacterium tyrofermentans TaxID=47848 RepID=A0ABW0FH26_9MICO
MASGILEAPRKLEKRDGKKAFASGAGELDTWLKEYAWQNQRANNAVTYVSVLDGEVVGFYAIAAAGVSHESVGADFSKRRPDPIPCVLLARLAVDERAQGRGVGANLFRDAIQRSLAVSEGMGAAALLIHCRDESARSFYLGLVDAFPSPVDDLHLIVPMRAIADQLQS